MEHNTEFVVYVLIYVYTQNIGMMKPYNGQIKVWNGELTYWSYIIADIDRSIFVLFTVSNKHPAPLHICFMG